MNELFKAINKNITCLEFIKFCQTNPIYKPYQQYWEQWFHSKTPTEKAYKVIRALTKAKIINLTTVEQFFSTLDEITKVI